MEVARCRDEDGLWPLCSAVDSQQTLACAVGSADAGVLVRHPRERGHRDGQGDNEATLASGRARFSISRSMPTANAADPCRAEGAQRRVSPRSFRRYPPIRSSPRHPPSACSENSVIIDPRSGDTRCAASCGAGACSASLVQRGSLAGAARPPDTPSASRMARAAGPSTAHTASASGTIFRDERGSFLTTAQQAERVFFSMSRSMPTANTRTGVDLRVPKDASHRDLSDAAVRFNPALGVHRRLVPKSW